MKKIIAIWLSINLLVLQAVPATAIVPFRQAPKGLKKGPSIKMNTGNSVRPTLLNEQVAKVARHNMQLPLTTRYTALLTSKAYVPAARQMLTHPQLKERALLLRTDFTVLALHNQVAPADQLEATSFYRNNLAHDAPFNETVADIASLGLLGEKADGAVILKKAQKAIGTPEEAAITAAAARALLRLEAYQELEALDKVSQLQPQLWEGVRIYATQYKLPVRLLATKRTPVDVTALQTDLFELGPINSIIVNPSLEATYLYMNAGRDLSTSVEAKSSTNLPPWHETYQRLARQALNETGALPKDARQTNNNSPILPAQDAHVSWHKTYQRLAQQALNENTPALIAENKGRTPAFQKAAGLFDRLPAADGADFTQRAALYLTAFSIGLEIGTPIMASIKSALNLPLSYAILVTAATYSPYLFGSFIANWLKGKIGRKNTVNTGIALMGGSFALGAAVLGLDGSFSAWDNPLAQYMSILATLTTASTGAVFIHNATGPIMTEISQQTSDLVRQKRGTYIELARSVGMMSSFAFPFLATGVLGLDWSAPFIMALPFVAASAVGLNLAKLPNSKPVVSSAPKLAQSPVMDGTRKPRKALQWKNSLLNNGYVRLLREEPGVANFIGGLFIMNAVEIAFNSGFLFMVPQLTPNESAQYLFGMAQFAVAFLAGRYLAGHFLKWFPQHNISVATLLAAISGTAALGVTDNVYALTAALFTAELGISTGFTLAFARTAKNHLTQDRVTSLIMASAVSCALGPILLTQVAQGLINAGILSESNATIASLIAIPSVLTFLSTKLFRNMEGGNSFKESLSALWTNIKKYFRK